VAAGKIILPFTAGEANPVMEPGPSGKAAITVLLDGKPVGEARGADVGTDGAARVDPSGMLRLVAGAATPCADFSRDRSRPQGVRVYLRTLTSAFSASRRDGCCHDVAMTRDDSQRRQRMPEYNRKVGNWRIVKACCQKWRAITILETCGFRVQIPSSRGPTAHRRASRTIEFRRG
jgi:hypothetical protein